MIKSRVNGSRRLDHCIIVSLEIEKRRQILEQLGCEVRLISGPIQVGADFVIDDLEFDSPEIRQIKESSFMSFGRPPPEPAALIKNISDVSRQIERAFIAYCEAEGFDAILLHNIFSHGRHIAAASAFAGAASKLTGTSRNSSSCALSTSEISFRGKNGRTHSRTRAPRRGISELGT